MITYKALQADRRQFLALTGLTLSEFQRLLSAFPQAYQQLYPANRTAEGQPRQRSVGGGCKGCFEQPEDKLLFLLVYLKTYPLQAVMAELFDLSQPRVNYWIHRLLPVLRLALDDLGVLPERDATHFAQAQGASGKASRLIIDATERRRQRPKNPEKQDTPRSSPPSACGPGGGRSLLWLCASSLIRLRRRTPTAVQRQQHETHHPLPPTPLVA